MPRINKMIYNVSNSEELLQALNTANASNEKTDIYLKDEVFELNAPLNIKQNNIHFHGIKDKTVITGSTRILFNRCKQYHENILKFDLSEIGVESCPEIPGGPYNDFWFDYETMKPYLDDYCLPFSLYYNKKAMPLSRYPKKDFINIKSICGETKTYDPFGKITGCEEAFFSPDDPTALTWETEDSCILVGYWLFDWAMQRQKIKKISDGVIELEKPYHAFGYGLKGHFFGLNLFSALSEKGEWCFDIKKNCIYVIPDENQTFFSISRSNNLISMSGIHTVTFENIIFEECLQSAVVANNCSDILFNECTLRNTGGWGIIAENNTNFEITNCTFYSIGGGAVSLTGGDRNTLTMSGNLISDCEFYDIGTWHIVYTPAVKIDGVGSTVKNNKFHHMPHTAILFHGNEHIISGNDISNVCLLSNDAGAIYAGKDWSCRGNKILFNYFHNIHGFQNKGCIALYFDDCFSSAEVYGNLFYDCITSIMIGGGRDFHVHNNTFHNCITGINIDCRLNNWASKSIDIMKSELNKVDYKNEIWQRAYPELTNILNESYRFPQHNRITDNLFICKNDFSFLDESKEYTIVENNLSIDKPSE